MKRMIVFSLVAVMVAGVSLAMAQDQTKNLDGGPGPSSSSNDTYANAIKPIIEMTLLYKLLGQPSLVSCDGGIVVLFGNKLSKYDKDLNLVKEINLEMNINSMQDLVTKIATNYSQEVVKSMGGVMASSLGGYHGNLLKTQMSPNDALAKVTLKAISTAAESYATANNGQYPNAASDLLLANPPYLNTNYCEKEIAGYYYTCDFTKTGYKITAKPVKMGDTGSTKYVMTTGGVLTP